MRSAETLDRAARRGEDPGRTPARGRLRLLRVAILGGSSLLLSSASHVAAGGSLPSPWVLLLLGVGLGMVAVTLTGRRCRLWLLLMVLGGQQMFLHLVFDGLTGAGLASSGDGHHPGLQVVADGPVTAEPASSAASAIMVTGHVLATVLMAWLLSRGEAALWRLADRVARAVGRTSGWPDGSRTREAAGTVVARCWRTVIEAAAPRGPPPMVVAS